MQDKAIVELFLERNERAIREASEKYNHYCMHISMNILDNIEDSEECVNDALLGNQYLRIIRKIWQHFLES